MKSTKQILAMNLSQAFRYYRNAAYRHSKRMALEIVNDYYPEFHWRERVEILYSLVGKD